MEHEIFDGDYAYSEWRSLAVREYAEAYAEAYGEKRPHVEYMLSPYDTWVKNPYYTGIAGPHPDFDEEE